MKRNIMAAFALTVILVSCQKNIETPISSASSSSVSNIGITVPSVTFAKPSAYSKISTAKANAIFNDSISINQKDAFLQVLKFDVNGMSLNLSNYTLLINGVKQMATISYENNVLTVTLNKAKSLSVGNHTIEVKAKVEGAAQIFSVGLKQTNVIITNRAGIMATMKGLPLQSSIVLK